MLVANIQGPIIPEFNQEWIPGGGYAGLDLLDKRPIVTVYGPDGPAKKSRGIGRRALKAKAKKAIEEAEKSA